MPSCLSCSTASCSHLAARSLWSCCRYGLVEKVYLRSLAVDPGVKVPKRVAIITGQTQAGAASNAYVVFTDDTAAKASLAHNMQLVSRLASPLCAYVIEGCSAVGQRAELYGSKVCGSSEPHIMPWQLCVQQCLPKLVELPAAADTNTCCPIGNLPAAQEFACPPNIDHE